MLKPRDKIKEFVRQRTTRRSSSEQSSSPCGRRNSED